MARTVVRLRVAIEVDASELVPVGHLEAHPDGSPDVHAILTHRLVDAFRFVPGVGAVRVRRVRSYRPTPAAAAARPRRVM